MELTSPDFEHQTKIPKKYTCDDGDISPELHWSGAPAGTQRFARITDAPDTLDPANPKKNLEKTMEGHILKKTELVGLYHR